MHVFLSYGHFLSYGNPLVPCCPDKRDFTVFGLLIVKRDDIAPGGYVINYTREFLIPNVQA